jgi:pteridine reductase
VTTESPDLQGKVALITGAARRIGAVIARMLHGHGMNVVLHYRTSGADARALCDGLNAIRPGSAALLAADLGGIDDFDTPIAEAAGHWGRLDALVNNASSFYPTPVGTITRTQWHDLIDSNLRAPLFLSQASAGPLAERQGCIVSITDIHAEWPLKGYTVYSIAKAGLVMMTRSLARELGPNVRVNAVAPGAILWPEDDIGAAQQAKILARTALKRQGDPGDIARAVLFLVRDAPYVTGQVIAVDGGRSLYI